MRNLDLVQEGIFTFIKELSSSVLDYALAGSVLDCALAGSVLDYALASEGIINNILDFNIGVE
jgi:hypothetical protein